MMKIWKLPLKLVDRQVVSVPAAGAHLLHVGQEFLGDLALWAMVKLNDDGTGGPRRDIEIIMVGTGQPLPHVGAYLGTVVDAAFVWHWFTGPDSDANMPPNGAFHYLTSGRA